MKNISLLAVLGAGLMLAGCYGGTPTQWGTAPTQWDKTNSSAKDQQADQADCRQRAAYQTEREGEREGPFANEQRDVRLQQMFDRHDQTMRLRQLYDNCMRDKGYSPVVSEGK